LACGLRPTAIPTSAFHDLLSQVFLFVRVTRVTDVDRFYADHRQGVFRYLRRIVGEAEAARDLTQEVFLRVSRAGLPESTDVGRRAWVFRIARNLALNHVRDGRHRPTAEGLPDRPTPGTQELGAALRSAIDALPALERDLFLLREVVGLRYDEMAAACDVSVETVRSRLHQARIALRAALGVTLDVRGQRGVRCSTAGPGSTRDRSER
jgi:RNA polymerase sigma-70 factor (ECF subfamily)